MLGILRNINKLKCRCPILSPNDPIHLYWSLGRELNYFPFVKLALWIVITCLSYIYGMSGKRRMKIFCLGYLGFIYCWCGISIFLFIVFLLLLFKLYLNVCRFLNCTYLSIANILVKKISGEAVLFYFRFFFSSLILKRRNRHLVKLFSSLILMLSQNKNRFTYFSLT